ncbi:MAG: hydantoinase/oxoprolinase family protein [Desulfobacterales bacterium]
MKDESTFPVKESRYKVGIHLHSSPDHNMYAKAQNITGRFQKSSLSDDLSGNFVVGIDTGGTYTDGVLMDYQTRHVIASGKTLTTRGNLENGVIAVLKKLKIKDPSGIKLVGISSTLSTNSIAEGKAREVGLILIGYDPDLIESFRLDANFNTAHIAYFKGGHTSQGDEKEPLDIDAVKTWVNRYKDTVDAFAVSSYFSPLNSSHEETVFHLIEKCCDLPVVLGHQLSTKLDSVKRASTACLNASLVAVMQEFILAVQKALINRKIRAPLMIVKGDGSLMPHSEAIEKPVETILSGPAASAMGGLFLSGTADALMIDIGGTTTDMAFIRNSQIIISDEGPRVGNIETAVKAARIRTICVGCDSRIRIDQWNTTQVGPDRVVPLSRLASYYPSVRDNITALANRNRNTWTGNDIVYWFLNERAKHEGIPCENPKHETVIRLLKKGPVSMAHLLASVGVYHAVQLNADDLLRQGVIEESTLTPTDLLHANGKLDKWDAQVARQAVDCACTVYGKDKKVFVEETLESIIASIVEEAIVFLARQTDGHLPENLDGEWSRWLLNEAINGRNGSLSVNIAGRFPIIGIGAPAGIFIEKVARALKAPFILPDHAHAANAAGAVAGSVISEKEALIYIRERGDTRTYIVQIDACRTHFPEYGKAAQFARQQVAGTARERATTAGAASPLVHVTTMTEGSVERIKARAVGNPKLLGTVD